MKKLSPILAALAAILLAGATTACGASSTTQPETEHADEGDHGGEHGAEEAEPAKGPHGGRLLEQDAFAVEVTIFESGVDPQYRVYPTLDGKAVAPETVELQIALSRLGGKTDTFRFTPEQDYLKGDGVVAEPHSFDVTVQASYQGKTYTWDYESYEGRVTIADEAATGAGVQTGSAGPAVIRTSVDLSGTVQLPPSARAEVRAVYPGRVISVGKTVGDTVGKGETLAVVENSSSLQTYSVRAPIAGTILERRTNAGDVAASEPLFVIGDTEAAQAELHVYPKDAGIIKVGQKVRVRIAGGELTADGVIDRFLPIAEQGTQSLIAMVKLPRGSGLRPGMRVTGTVEVSETEVPLAVRESGLQRFRDFTVVFAEHGDTYEVRMLDLGKSDGEFVEVLGGIDPGEAYVTENSFLIKADIEKSGASHDH
jgi:cobalt-zinc-cadmium efflux system membrane fusion protein